MTTFTCPKCGCRDRIDGLLEFYVNGPSFKKVGEIYGEKGKYALYLAPKETEKQLNWYNAMDYCKSLGGDLPTIDELQYLYDNCNEEFQNTFYWSSSHSQDSATHAWRMTFYNGLRVHSNKMTTRRVRAVRRVSLPEH